MEVENLERNVISWVAYVVKEGVLPRRVGTDAAAEGRGGGKKVQDISALSVTRHRCYGW